MKDSFKIKTAVILLRLLSRTWRIKVDGNIPEKPAVIAFWHGLMLPAWKIFEGKSAHAVVSLSKDGSMLSALLRTWGFRLIRGSSSRDGKKVLTDIISNAETGYVLITPDGPRGPRYEMKPGAVIGAQKSGAPLYLCRVNVKKAKIFKKSWDHFRLPMPFSSVKISFSTPFFIKKDASREEISSFIEECKSFLNKDIM